MKDEKLLWIYGNPTILDLYNIDPNNYIGKSEEELLPEEFAQSCIQSDIKAKNAKKVSISEERAKDKHGNINYYEVFKVPNYEDDEFKGLIGVGRDITKTKEIQEKLTNKIKEQKKFNHKLKMASLGEMLENITHQWKQPLNNLNVLATSHKLYQDNNIEISENEKDKMFNEIIRNVQFMNKTIDTFKSYFSKNDEKEEFTLKVAIEDALNILHGTLIKNSITINLDLEKNLVVYGVKNEFIQIIINLLSNAKDALIEKNIKNRTITIETKKENNNLIIKVKDNAIGISQDILEKIFESYFTTKKENDGAVFEISIPYLNGIDNIS